MAQFFPARGRQLSLFGKKFSLLGGLGNFVRKSLNFRSPLWRSGGPIGAKKEFPCIC
jgi:hypothetical protein